MLHKTGPRRLRDHIDMFQICGTQVNEMSQMLVKQNFCKSFFCKNCESNNLEILSEYFINSLVFILSVFTIGTVYLSLFYVLWCHVRRAERNVPIEFYETTQKTLIALNVG